MKLKLLSTCTIDFYTSVFERQSIPDILKHISLSNKHLEIASDSKIKSTSKNYILQSVPNYMNLGFNQKFHIRKATIKPGLAISLKKEYTSVEDYLKAECSNSFRKVAVRSIKRLELCFNIRYKTFFGNISEEECKTLMELLNIMISKRFSQRSGRNKALKNWGYFVDLAYKGINNRTASLFVTYDGNLPIQISLCYNVKNILVGSVSSYDLDYSKFSLGNIGLYKEIEWCLNNNMDLFDIGFGDFAYKRRWSNLVYDFETLYLSESNNIFSKLYFSLHEKKEKLLYYLISKEFNNLYFDTISKLKGEKANYDELRFEEFDASGHTFSQDNIAINSDVFGSIKKPLCDYVYNSKERLDDLKVYKATNNKDVYLIIGKQGKSEVKLVNE